MYKNDLITYLHYILPSYVLVDLCNRLVELSGQPIYSPNYPELYDNNEICITFIQNNDDCIAIDFVTLDINNGNNGGDTCTDDLLLVRSLMGVDVGWVWGEMQSTCSMVLPYLGYFFISKIRQHGFQLKDLI